jgi:c-di-GMP-binding flagellar brake protein YcgR
MPQSRSVRVATDPYPVRIARASGRLVNVSATGALVHLNRALAKGASWPVRVTLEPGPVELEARVVRCEAISVDLSGATWLRAEYGIGLAFTRLSPVAREALQQLCGDAFTAQQ